MRDAYEVLGVPRSASRLAIHRRYRQLAKRLHPDRNPAPDAGERFRELHDAYGTLIDPERRRELDLAFGSPSAARPAAHPPRPAHAAAKDPIQQWRDDNRRLHRTVNAILGGFAGAFLGARVAVTLASPWGALVAVLDGAVFGLLGGYLFGKLEVFDFW